MRPWRRLAVPAAIILLCWADVWLTVWGLRGGWVYEANPIMARLFAVSTQTAVGYALVTGTVAPLVLYAYRGYRWWVPVGLWVLLAMRVGVMATHGIWLWQVFAI